MAQKKRRVPAPRKRRSWTAARFLLILGYGVVFAFLGVIYMMRQELFRVGIFGEKQAVRTPAPRPASPPQVTTESQRPASSSPPQVAKEEPRSAPSASAPSSHAGEITAAEKKALEDILRSKR
jgi:hypothetical protein